MSNFGNTVGMDLLMARMNRSHVTVNLTIYDKKSFLLHQTHAEHFH